MIGVAVALDRAVQRADEHGRIVMLECMALGFGTSMITAMTLGFLGRFVLAGGSHGVTARVPLRASLQTVTEQLTFLPISPLAPPA